MTEEFLSPEREAFLKADFSRGFISYVGYKASSFSRGRCESHLAVRPDHRQQDGFIHAGVMAAMADHTAGYAAFTLVPPGIQILTIEFKVNFLRPAAGDTLICRASIVREGKSVVVGLSEVFCTENEVEKKVAMAVVTMTPVPGHKLKKAQE